MSLDVIKGIREGERSAKAAASAKRRGAKLAGGSGSGKSKTRFTRKEGRAALNRGGRGIAIQNQKSIKGGKGLRGVIDYALNPEKSPELIYSNCGQDAKTILRTMQKFASFRPDIDQERQVGHVTISLPPRVGKIDSELWIEMLQSAREKLSLDDSFACAAVRHGGCPHDHLHLLFCRVSVNGKVHDKANIGLRCTATEALLEKQFNLEMVPEEEFKTRGHISKGEMEKAIKLGKLPPRMQIAAAIQAALQGNQKPSTAQFCERLQASGIGIKANVASTGKMNGFSFTFDGIAFTASKIAKEYGWKSLSEKIDFDPERDAELLANLDGGLGTASRDLVMANRAVSELAEAVESVQPPTTEIQAILKTDQPTEELKNGTSDNQHNHEFDERQSTRARRNARFESHGFHPADAQEQDFDPARFEPTAASVSRVRTLSEIHVAAGAQPSEMLLHGNARIQLVDSGADTDSIVRWADGEGRLKEKEVAHEKQNGDVARPAGIDRRADPSGGDHAKPVTATGERNRTPERVPATAAAGTIRANPAPIIDRASKASNGAKSKTDTRTQETIPGGFVRATVLDSTLDGWISGLHNRIARNCVPTNTKQQRFTAYLDQRDRIAAISTRDGFVIPDPQTLTDAQLTALLIDAGEVAQPVKIEGTPDFCQRVDTLAKAQRLVVTHDHQVSDAELQAAQRRYEERQREELSRKNANQPGYRPGGA